LLFYQPLVHYHLGVVLAVQGKLTPAIQSLQRALEFRPQLAAAHEVLAQTYHARGEKALARAHKLRARELKAARPREADEEIVGEANNP
jgi:Flp pilus assembly protein TadD